MDKMKLAAALVGGYLLGRSKKGLLALTVAGAIGARKLAGSDQQIELSPDIKRLGERITGDLFDAAKGAAVAVAARGVNTLNTNLQDRTEQMRGAAGGDESDEAEEPEEAEEDRAAEESASEEEAEEEDLPEEESEEAED